MSVTGEGAQTPENVEALIARGERARNAGRLAEAIAIYRQVLALRPDIGEVHNNLGILLATSGKPDRAVGHLQQAIRLRPQFSGAYANLGAVLGKLGRLDEAVTQLERAVALDPNLPGAHNNLGTALLQSGRLEEAGARLQTALALQPDYPDALSNLGDVLIKQSKFDQALGILERAIALDPGLAIAHFRLAGALVHLGRFDEAVAGYQRALACRPDFPQAQYGLATCWLVQGDFERGWPAYEARLLMPDVLPPPPFPRWNGEPLSGKRLLLRAEQGIGDTIQFLRYTQCFRERGAWVALAVPDELVPLLKSYRDVDELCFRGSDAPPPVCDFWLPLLSVPYALGTTATIPSQVPYLFPDPELVQRWRQELSAIDGFKIGIAWQGSVKYAMDRWRSLPLGHFAPLARLPGVRLISLQKGYGSEQIAGVDFPVVDLGGRLDEQTGTLVDTAAVIRNLDLVVTVDTALGHLAGAMAAPVWVALQFSPDWRWLVDGDDSPWYPTVRLFRQSAPGQWSDVFQRIAAAVATRCSASR